MFPFKIKFTIFFHRFSCHMWLKFLTFIRVSSMYIWVQYTWCSHSNLSVAWSTLDQASMHLVSDSVRLCTLRIPILPPIPNVRTFLSFINCIKKHEPSLYSFIYWWRVCHSIKNIHWPRAVRYLIKTVIEGWFIVRKWSFPLIKDSWIYFHCKLSCVLDKEYWYWLTIIQVQNTIHLQCNAI